MKKVKANSPPIAVAIPSIATEKWQAIAELARANRALADAINGVTIDISIANCVIEAQNGSGITIDSK